MIATGIILANILIPAGIVMGLRWYTGRYPPDNVVEDWEKEQRRSAAMRRVTRPSDN